MNLNNIVLEALYEIKCTRRCVLFNLLVIIGLSCTFVLPSLLFSSEGKMSFASFNPPWYAQALSSSLPFTTAYCYNIIQVLVVTFMASNDLRRTKLTAMSALDVHSQSNMDIIIGCFLGRVVVFSCMSILLFFLAISYNAIYYPKVLNILYYLFYWLTLTFPTLIYFLGVSVLITRATNNQGISILLLLTLAITTTIYGADIMYNLPDPIARYIPNLFSDFTGHACLRPYLLHRTIYLFLGIFLLIISAITCQRIPNTPHPVRTNLLIAGCPLTIIIVLTSIYYIHFDRINQNENQYRQLYLEHDASLKAQIVTHDIVLQEIEKNEISAESRMTMSNRNPENVSIMLYLNPGLQVDRLTCNNHPLSFERNGQIILTGKQLAPGDTCCLTMKYRGTIDNTVCYLDIPASRKNSPFINSYGIFHFGNQPAFCTTGYKLFTPECLWYPVCIPPTCFTVSQIKNFTRYSLTVLHDENHTAISQGKALNKTINKTIFLHDHDLQGISLCIGKFKKASLFLNSVQMQAYYKPEHEYLLSCFKPDTNIFENQLGSYIYLVRKEEKNNQPSSRNNSQQNNRTITPIYNLKYPYTWLRLVETPISFCNYTKNDEIDGEMIQCGMIFLPEKLSTAYYQAKWLKLPDKTEINDYLHEFLENNFHDGKYNIQSLITRNQGYVNSNKYPMINEVLQYLTRYNPKSLHKISINDYYAIKYMSHHSLLDAINDKDLSTTELRTLIQKKSYELRTLICSQVSDKRFSTFLYHFFKSHRFKNINENEFEEKFKMYLNIDLEDILQDWYHRNQLPVFRVESKCYKYTSDWHEHVYNIHYKVYNSGNVDGVIKSSTGECWNISKHSCKNIFIKSYDLGDSYFLELPMSQNLPDCIVFKNYEPAFDTLNMREGVFDADSNYFKQDSSEIILTILDPACEQVNTTNWVRNIYNYFKTDSLVFGFSLKQKQEWKLAVGPEYLGFPVQGELNKPIGSGKNYIEWNTKLQKTGDYELFFYIVKSQNKFCSLYENTLYFSIYDGSHWHDINVTYNDQTTGWISLGQYKFTNHEVKVVFYDKQDFISNLHSLSSRVIHVNAIKLYQL
ncbi:hypothetical protein [uncultured Butyricimonas sp.]|uniref:ABC transporter permease/M1 family aminopeptidase n=1 Tax=uncultured Butyricimonas sp. TaxID=1268785 RepID=UPI0026DD3381|nr:hypothetical protein [uncultured Butyricimonas sp.]